jgi:hypothetical protein
MPAFTSLARSSSKAKGNRRDSECKGCILTLFYPRLRTPCRGTKAIEIYLPSKTIMTRLAKGSLSEALGLSSNTKAKGRWPTISLALLATANKELNPLANLKTRDTCRRM